MYPSIRNFNIPPGISRGFDFKSSPGSREFDVLSLPYVVEHLIMVEHLIRVGNLNRKS
jgi:hypothetical protein